MIAGAMREVDGIRILMFSSPWPSRSPVSGTGFQTKRYWATRRTKRGTICMQ
jgi:hypothetical protein